MSNDLLVKDLETKIERLSSDNERLQKELQNYENENKKLRQELVVLESMITQNRSVRDSPNKVINIYL